MVVSCTNDLDNPNLTEPKLSKFEQEIAFPNRTGEQKSFETKDGKTFYYLEIDNFKVFEGDILISEELVKHLKKEDTTVTDTDKNMQNKAIAALSRRWTNSTVNFNISLPHRRDDILWAINHIELNTNIRFNETATGNYIDFVTSDGCSSYIGMTGGRQLIRLADGCIRGSIVHEICHALGVFHEQSRPDRDDHIIIHWQNIIPDAKPNFETELAHNYGSFNFGSIMMYSSWAFNLPGTSLPTITKLDGSTFSTQRSGLSNTDINGLTDMYPGPNKIKPINDPYNDILDIGANNNSDVVYLKRRRYYVDLYKNNVVIQSYRSNAPTCVDITSSGQILTNFSGYNTGIRGYTTIDISEGGGNIYCLANNTRQTNLYKKNGNSWSLIASNIQGKRVTVDLVGRPWVLQDGGIRLYQDNGSFTTLAMPAYASIDDRLVDIGSAGNEIYVSMRHIRNGRKQLLKYSHYASQLIRQPGEANLLDGHTSGIVWTNL